MKSLELFRLIKIILLLLCLNGLTAFAEIPIRGFGQVGAVSSSTDNAGTKENTNNFYNGALDLFLSTNISKRVLFLSEVGFELSEENGTNTDIERLTVQFIYSPWFKIGAGRFHTALGYWNDNYHHGSWLHASVARPLAYHFEDDGGILPTHSEGLEIRGEGDLGPGQLGYIFNIANGRGPRVDPPQIVNDQDQAKATNLLLYYTLPNMGNLRFGGLYYSDTLPGCSYDSGASPAVNTSESQNCTFKGTGAAVIAKGHEAITGVHLVYAPGQLEFLFEYFNIKHKFDTGEENANINSGYGQLSYHIDDWTPYYRFDLMEVLNKKTDAYSFAEGKTTANVIGVRYDFEVTSALKLEYTGKEHLHADNSKDLESQVSANWSFTF